MIIIRFPTTEMERRPRLLGRPLLLQDLGHRRNRGAAASSHLVGVRRDFLYRGRQGNEQANANAPLKLLLRKSFSLLLTAAEMQGQLTDKISCPPKTCTPWPKKGVFPMF